MSGREPKVEWLNVVGDAETWRSLGLTVTDEGLIPLMGTSIRIVDASQQSSAPALTSVPIPADATDSPIPHSTPSSSTADAIDSDESADGAVAAKGIVGWALSGVDPTNSTVDVPEAGAAAPAALGEVAHEAGAPGSAAASESIDGLVTDLVEPATPVFAAHALGASALDHVVVLTADLERTSGAIADATGCELKRIREVGEMRQGFHRIGRGGLIVELVERPGVPLGPADFWGLVLIVDDLEHACKVIGADRISDPKDAVQPGRRIATVRADVGLGLPVALMTS